EKIVMLGALLHPTRASIDDPYQLSSAETEQVGAQVETGLDELATLLGLAPGGAVIEPPPRAGIASPGR
ncbi:MAG: hypothetical protein ACREK4_01745, partial [Candidatus Rokuibacteriota bacterium]